MEEDNNEGLGESYLDNNLKENIIIEPLESRPPLEVSRPTLEELEKRVEELPKEVKAKEEEVAVDFSKLAKKAKSFFKNMKKEGPHHKETPSNKDDESINFSEIKDKTKNFFKGLKGDKKRKEEKEDEGLDLKKAIKYTKDNARWIIPLLLILIAITTSTYFRMQSSYLPITDDWAQNTVYNHYQSQLSNQIAQQYPNLPKQNRDSLLQKEFEKFLEQNKDQISKDITQVSQQYKAQFKDENGDTYLLAIDPYLWYSEARNVVNHGHLGDIVIDGKSYFTLRDGRLNKESTPQLHPYFAAYLYKFLHFFNPNLTLMRALFLLPAIIIGLSMIPAFFIGRMMVGNVGGFFAAMFLAVNGPLLGRTPAGFSDTDPYNILFPLMIAWLFLEAMVTKDNKKRYIYTTLSALFVGLFAGTWGGWSFAFLFMLGVLGLTVISRAVKEKTFNIKKIVEKQKKHFIVLGTFLLASGIFVTLFRDFRSYWKSFIRPIQFMTLKDVGIKSIWPNVLTTVAEFNTTSFKSIINQMGGKFLFTLAVVGILILLLKKDEEDRWQPQYFIILLIWLLSTAYAFTKGTRFAILIAPAFALSLGSFLGYAYQKCSYWISKGIRLPKAISKITVLAVLLLLLITPLSTAEKIAKNEVPSMNDSWYNTLTKIKNDSEKAIITSWWDFGHWFVAIAERMVTFDGGNNNNQRIHWVGKTLLTKDETEAVGILRMLNCAQETASAKLNEFTANDSLKSVNMLYEIFQTPDRDQAYLKYQELGLTKEQAAVMLDYTHCEDLIPNYYITSDDMIGKAGVWGHFGSWNFKKAVMYQKTNQLSRPKAVAYLTEKFNLTEQEADKLHYEIQNTKGDNWIAPWPGYLSTVKGCDMLTDTEVKCAIPFQSGEVTLRVNLNTYNVTIDNNPGVMPNSLVYATKDGVVEKKFAGDKTSGFSAVLIPSGDNYGMMITDPLQAASMFTRLFFFDGHGLQCFSKFDDVQQFTGGKIATWKVDYDCQQQNKVFFLPKEEVHASHILVLSEGRTDEEAIELITQIQGKVTSQNFAELAKQYSEDPGSAANGGDLGWFGKGAMVPEFEKAAFSLQEGHISDAVKTPFGYHLIYLQEKR